MIDVKFGVHVDLPTSGSDFEKDFASSGPRPAKRS